MKEPCREVLRLAARHPRYFSTDAEVLQEMLHRYLSLGRWPQGRRVVLAFADLMAGSVERVGAEDAIRACDLADRYAMGPRARLAARDLLHAAVILRAEAPPSKIVTADGNFDELGAEGIERLDPADVGAWRREIEVGDG